MRTCTKCGVQKPLTDFYINRYGGHTARCKECTKQYTHQWYAATLEQRRAFGKQRRQRPEYQAMMRKLKQAYRLRPEYKDQKRKSQDAYRSKYPDKYKAHIIMGHAVRDGKLQKQPCLHCGALKVEAHHPDYSKPLDVVWLCMPCHKQHHVREQEKTKR